jgi:hypothetical protein
MTSAPYSVTSDVETARVRIVVSGFWTSETAPSFLAAVQSHFDKLERLGKPYRLLTDASDFTVQNVEVATLIENFWKLAIGPGLERQALVITSALARMQAARILEGTPVRIFDNIKDAEAWLEE